MDVEEARNIFAKFYPNLPLAVKKAVKFTLANRNEMKNIPLALQPFEFTVAEAKSFLQSLSALPTDARVEDKIFISKLNCAVAALQTDLSVWCRLEDFPHEEWRDVAGFEGHYQVSNYGRIKSFKNHIVIIMRFIYTKDGYLEASLSKNGVKKRTGVHVVVAKAFIPNPENKPQVNHENTNSLNNCLWNLNWATNSENQKHAVRIGTKKIGYRNPRAKLTPDQVRFIREHYIPRDKEFSLAAFSRKFGVGITTLKKVVTEQGYKNV